MQLLLLVGLVGAFATFVDAIIGMGFGMLSTSLLLTVGIYPAVASASIHIGKIGTGLLSGGAHLYFGNVKMAWLGPLAISGSIGGASGAFFLSSLPGAVMKPYVSGILLVLGIIVLLRFLPLRTFQARLSRVAVKTTNTEGGQSSRLRKPSRKLPALGFVAAFVDAVGGGGWGSMVTPGLMLAGNDEPRKVIGTVNVAEIFAAAAISVTFIVTLGFRALPWDLVACLMVGGIVSAPLGAYLCKRLPTRLLGLLTALLLIAFNLAIIIASS